MTGEPLEPSYPDDAWDLLAPLLTPERRARIETVVRGRSRRVRLVVQDVHQPHNVSACLRSADAFGIQDVDVVTLRQPFKASTVARGVNHWLTVHRHQDVESCAQALKAAGYRLFAGLPTPGATSVNALPVQDKIALVFGNEHSGIDAAWRAFVEPFTIPMAGMVESLNISVSAAISLHQATTSARQALGDSAYHLPPAEQRALLNTFACRQFSSWEEILPRLRTES